MQRKVSKLLKLDTLAKLPLCIWHSNPETLDILRAAGGCPDLCCKVKAGDVSSLYSDYSTKHNIL